METDFQKNLQAALQPLLDMQRRLEAALGPAVQPMLEVSQALDAALKNSALQEVTQRAARLFHSPFLDKLRDIARDLEDFSERLEESIMEWASRGWYPVDSIPIAEIQRIANDFRSGHAETAEERILQHLRADFETLAPWALRVVPKRSTPLRAAFDAHRRGEYCLSIPVMLAQADGICRDITGIQLYKRRQKVYALEEWVTGMLEGSIRRIWLLPTIRRTPLTANESERGPEFEELNRHAVLHGETSGYGTEINSWKAFSHLVYILESIHPEAMNDAA